MKTKTIFRFFSGEVLALFPEMPGNYNPSTCGSYARVGQHGSADPLHVVRASRLATRAEYLPLAAELRRIGYRLQIMQRIPRGSYYVRRAEILKTRATA